MNPIMLTPRQVEALKVEALYSAKAGLGRSFSDDTVLRLIATIESLQVSLRHKVAT